MMNNSMPTSDSRAIGESISQCTEREERAGLKEEAKTEQTTMTKNIESEKNNNYLETTISQVENSVGSTKIDKIINENSVTSEQKACGTEAEKKPSKNHGGTIKLMQDVKDPDNDPEQGLITTDETNLSNTSTIHERYGRAKNSICWTILCESRNPLITPKILRAKKKSRSGNKIVADSTFKLRPKPIPAKEWVWIYHRRLIRQNAFCNTWPEN